MVKLASKLVSVTLTLALICSGYSSVLCYGGDGHIAVEPVFHSHCDHDHEHEDQGTHEDIKVHISDKCNPCVDVLISIDIEPVRAQLLPLSDLNSLDMVSADAVNAWSIIDTHRAVFTFFMPLKTIILQT